MIAANTQTNKISKPSRFSVVELRLKCLKVSDRGSKSDKSKT